MREITVLPCFLSELYHVLSAPRRCYSIQILAQTDGQPVTVRDLAREITAIEQGICREDATGEPYRNVYNALSQTHLNTMSAIELVDYQPQRQRVNPKQKLSVVNSVLRFDQAAYLLFYNNCIAGE